MMTVEPTFGPDRGDALQRLLSSADINGAPKPAFQLRQAQAEMEKILPETLPRGMGYEWTELVYQEKIAGNTGADLPAVRAAGVPGAGSHLRELDAAAGHHPDRADVHPERITGVWLSGFFGQPATTTSSRRSRWSCWSGWRARTRS
jgi:hypothetical protein